jgi:putative PIN family toxin of toxin-antitoxin system
MRIVLDTNVLLVSIGTNSPYRPIFDSILNGNVKLLLSTGIYLEYLEKLEEKTNVVVAKNIINMLLELEKTEAVNVSYRWNLIRTDPDDNKFTDCAIAGAAEYLVSDDKDYDILKQTPFPIIKLLSAKEFLALIKQSNEPR